MPKDIKFTNAALGGDLDFIQKTINAGDVDVNYKRPEGHGGETALILAAVNQHVEIVSALIAAGADVNIQDAYAGHSV